MVLKYGCVKLPNDGAIRACSSCDNNANFTITDPKGNEYRLCSECKELLIHPKKLKRKQPNTLPNRKQTILDQVLHTKNQGMPIQKELSAFKGDAK